MGDLVGLFGAIEIGFEKGPFMMNWDYHLESRVVSLGQRSQTEYLWYETDAFDYLGDMVARMLIQSRALRASSPAYQD